jgi:protein-S-isoprenylcysteine O-methyltransferase Ste14
MDVSALEGYPRVLLSASLIVVSFAIGAWGLSTLRKNRTPADPGKPTLLVVESGPYRFSRNPLYLALLLLFASFAVLMNSLWMFLLLPVMFFLLHLGVVLREEQYLQNRFGETYLDYRQRVRRWI